MHTWALFSCSSLITLTAYNLTHLPKTAKPAPEPEPDASDQVAEETKFSLDTMSGQFPEFERIGQPTSPAQPQLSRKIEEPPGVNPALYDPAQYQVREVDLVGGLTAANSVGVNYRVDRIAPLPTLVPPPPAVNPFPMTANPSARPIAPRPRPVAQPRPEPAAVAPSFAPRVTSPPASPVVSTPTPAKATPSPPAAAPAVTPTNEPADLFAALPDEIEIAPPTELPEPLATPPATPEMAMTDVVTFDPLAEMTTPEVATAPANPAMTLADLSATPPAVTDVATPVAEEPFAYPPVTAAAEPIAAPAPTVSMESAPARHDLIDRYCDRSLADTNAATREAVCDAGTSE